VQRRTAYKPVPAISLGARTVIVFLYYRLRLHDRYTSNQRIPTHPKMSRSLTVKKVDGKPGQVYYP
jgi:hypothetical protein